MAEDKDPKDPKDTLRAAVEAACPQAQWAADADSNTQITLPDAASWGPVARALHDQCGMDYLVTIVGTDSSRLPGVDTAAALAGPGGALGAVYFLCATATGRRLSVRVPAAGTREQPWLPSAAALWAIAGMYEREVYDFLGVIFIGNPDMRRLFLSIDWKGWPLRKDYDADPSLNPVSTVNERQTDFTDQWELGPDGSPVSHQVRVFQPQDFVVNIGPQHPATHGVLRFRTAVDGETIQKIDVYMGYIHRGVEKLCESLAYPQTLHFMDRLDYFSAHIYHHGLCLCIEKAAAVEVPERARVIRVMMDELSRIASHCLFLGTFCMDLGATTMLFYTLRVREQILDIMERTCGARMTFNYDTIGGVMQDIHPGFQQDVKDLIAVLPKNIAEYDKLFTGNVIARNRMEGVGVLSRAQAVDWSVTGPCGRGSGWACDVRKLIPYSGYQDLDFQQVVRTEGDAMARYKVRVDEMKQSALILQQLVDAIPDGPIAAKVPKVLKLPQGHWFQLVEGCRGAFGVYIESDGTAKPYRLKLVPPCLPLAAVVPTITQGSKIADLITIGGSMDYIIPDMDR